MKKRGAIVAGVIAAAMGLGGAAADAAITIDPNGSAPPVDGGALGTFNTPFVVTSLDWSQGNAIAQGAVTAIGNGVGSEFNLFYQATLRGFDGPGNVPVDNVTLGTTPGRFEWTIVAGFRERVVSTTANSATFELVKEPGEINFVEIYFDDTPNANALAGTGFSDGRLILRAEVDSIGFSEFKVTGFDGEPLDQNGTNNYPGVLTVEGAGVTTPLVSRVLEVDPTFFSGDTDNLALVVDLLFQNVTQNLPFLTVDPSAAFTTTAYAGSIGTDSGERANAGVGVGSVGLINGLTGPDVMFQVDSSSRFESTVIPEPATAGLGLMGLAALAMGLRRRRMA